MNLRSLVLDYLHTLQAQGVQRLAVDDEARGILRKPLMVLAHEFTPAAVKMLSLTGGRALLAVPREEA